MRALFSQAECCLNFAEVKLLDLVCISDEQPLLFPSGIDPDSK